MAGTSLKRKARRNKVVSKQRIQALKLHSSKPVIKNVDVEEMKSEFDKKPKKAEKPTAEKVEAKAEKATEAKAEKKVKAEKVEKTVKAEKKEPAKKAAKKETKGE